MSHTCDCEGVGYGASERSSIPCRAAQFLWNGYGAYRGFDGFDLCGRLGVPIRRSEMKPFRAYLLTLDEADGGGRRVIIPKIVPDDMSAREGLLIYHEIAHLILQRDDPFFARKRRWTQTAFDVAEEAWCDGFALAMLLAFFGWRPLADARGAHAFFRVGETLKPPRLDVLLGMRIRRLTRVRRIDEGRPPAPLHRLAKMLLQQAETAD